MAFTAGLPLAERWPLWSQVLFVVAGTMGLLFIVPMQSKQARLARAFPADVVKDYYRALSRRWQAWGLLSTVPLVIAAWLMVAKPGEASGACDPLGPPRRGGVSGVD